MKATMELPPSERLIEAALEGLVCANVVLIETGVVPSSPLDAKVRYRREPNGLEYWDVATRVVAQGWGDCEDLNGWHCAGLRSTGVDPGARVVLIRTGERCLHAVVERSDGGIEDVCPTLGMTGRGVRQPDEIGKVTVKERNGKRPHKPRRGNRLLHPGQRGQRTVDRTVPQEEELDAYGNPTSQSQPSLYDGGGYVDAPAWDPTQSEQWAYYAAQQAEYDEEPAYDPWTQYDEVFP